MGLHAPAPAFEFSPWARHWREGTGIREVRASFSSPSIQYTEGVSLLQDSSTHDSYSASIALPQVQSTYPVDRTLPPLWQVVGDLLYNTKGPEIACPRPIHPLPKWIDMAAWDDDEDETTLEGDGERIAPMPVPTYIDADYEGEERFDEDYDEELDFPHRFLPSFILSPDPEELPAPFFHPLGDPELSSHAPTSLSPEARNLPQPCFDPSPYSPVSDVGSRSSLPGFDRPRSPWLDSFGSIAFPNSGNLPPPDFEIHDRIEVGGFWKFPGPLDCRQDQLGSRGARGHAYRGLDGGFWEAAESGEREASGSEHRRRWPDWTWDR